MKKVLFCLLLTIALIPIGRGQGFASRTIVATDTTVCGVYEWIDGVTYANDTVVTLITEDTLFVLNLTCIQSDYTATPIAIQRSCRYKDWTVSGTYRDTVARPNGCDSIYTLNLTIAGTDTIDYPVVACDSATISYLNDTVLYTSKDTTFGVVADGCTSIYHLQLTINNSVRNDTTKVEADCSYKWNNQTITDNLVHSRVIGKAANQCDSIESLQVISFSNHLYDTVEVENCGKYSRWGNEYTESGLYTHDSVAANCTTFTTLNLTVKNNERTEEVEECDSYTWDVTKRTYTSSGTLTAEQRDTVVGCIMKLTLNLTIKYSPQVSIVGRRNIKPGQSTTLTATPSDANANYTYRWTAGDITSTETSIELTNVTDNIDVHLLTTNTDGGCQSNNWMTVTPYEGAGVEEVNGIEVSLYPNPATRYVIVESAEAMHEVVIYNTLGQIVASYKVEGTQASLDLTKLSNGHYSLRIATADGNSAIRKFIISK